MLRSIINNLFIIVFTVMYIVISSIEAPCATTITIGNVSYTEQQYKKMIDDSWSPVDFIGLEAYEKMCPYGDTFVVDVELSEFTGKPLGQSYDCIRPVNGNWEVTNYDPISKQWKRSETISNDPKQYRIFTMDGELRQNARGDVLVYDTEHHKFTTAF